MIAVYLVDVAPWALPPGDDDAETMREQCALDPSLAIDVVELAPYFADEVTL